MDKQKHHHAVHLLDESNFKKTQRGKKIPDFLRFKMNQQYQIIVFIVALSRSCLPMMHI